MKKNIFSIMLLMLMVGALMIFTTGCNSEDASTEFEARIAELEAENAALKARLEDLNAKAEVKDQELALKDWTLDATAWSDSNGATVTFTATPIEYVEGQRAALSVRMGDLEAESTNCVWDGSAFTGSVELIAVDGYSYFCVLIDLDGSQTEIELNSPKNTTDEALVYLGSSLSEYANLVVEDWSADASTLKLLSGYIQVQMPRMVSGNASVSISSADLVLQLNSEEIGRKTVTLEAGEGNDSFEAALSGISFEIPAMEDDYQLNLWLNVTMNSGKTISVIGGSWYQNNGELQLVVG